MAPPITPRHEAQKGSDTNDQMKTNEVQIESEVLHPETLVKKRRDLISAKMLPQKRGRSRV